MNCESDPAKNESNLHKHSLLLANAEGFERETVVVGEDACRPYAEPRFESTGYIGERLHVMVFCLRAETVGVISLCKANSREANNYAKT